MKSNRKFAAIMILVIMASIFILQFKNNQKLEADGQYNIEMYAETENISILEEEYAQNENSHIFKANSNFMFSLFKTYILVNVSLNASIYKHKHSSVISEICRLFNYSVFVVFYTNKSDGKKRMMREIITT
ncbi:hypothetical protein SDC9_106316 [bioreactor metagenome]|uniref:Uncharacterized protein n=1 Tax=bioreactor metagenome TaxID=1076179 RepID=A0A645B1Y5_9ZZZZ